MVLLPTVCAMPNHLHLLVDGRSVSSHSPQLRGRQYETNATSHVIVYGSKHTAFLHYVLNLQFFTLIFAVLLPKQFLFYYLIMLILY